jgi:hypothetical protein
MNLSEHYEKSVRAFIAKMDAEEEEGDLSEVIRLAKLYGYMKGYWDRDCAYFQEGSSS